MNQQSTTTFPVFFSTADVTVTGGSSCLRLGFTIAMFTSQSFWSSGPWASRRQKMPLGRSDFSFRRENFEKLGFSFFFF